MSRKIKVKKKLPKKEYLLGAGAAIVILIGGYTGQLLRESTSILSMGERYHFSFSPFVAIKTAFGCMEGLISMAVIAILLLVIYTYYSKHDMFNADPNDERNFRVSDQGTYGTANFADRERIEETFDIMPCEKVDGAILGMLDDKGLETVARKDYAPPSRHTLNPNIAIFGAAGTGKSRCYIRPAIFQLAKNNESMIITDTKGEMYRDMSVYLRTQGYCVKVFNLKDLACSDAWNIFDDLENEAAVTDLAQTLAAIVIDNTSGAKGDLFWDRAEMNLLTALTLYVLRDDKLKKNGTRGLGAVYSLLVGSDIESLDARFKILPESHEAKSSYQIFMQSSDSVRSGVVLGLATRLQVFKNEAARKITQYNEIDLTLPGKRKCAYFLIMSDQEGTYTFLSSLFFSFLFIRLVNAADSTTSGRLDVRTTLLLDEFCNIGRIPDFNKKISTVRSRNIAITMILQNLPQFKNRYPKEEWEEILGNCDIQVCLGCTDDTTARYVSQRSGTMTIDVSSVRTSRHTVDVMPRYPEYTMTASVGKRAVLNPDEVQTMDRNQCLLMVSGAPIMKINKFDYTLHPESSKMMLADPRKHKPLWLIKEEEKKKESTFVKQAEYKGGTPTQTRIDYQPQTQNNRRSSTHINTPAHDNTLTANPKEQPPTESSHEQTMPPQKKNPFAHAGASNTWSYGGKLGGTQAHSTRESSEEGK